jgi:16S rRNA (uracil1498-N3)-methyltransferase
VPPRRYFCPGLVPGSIELPAEESHHAATVIRSKAGEVVQLFDGAGGVATGIIEQVSRRRVVVAVERITQVPWELNYRLTLAVAMSKSHRQGYMVEKCTELGVAAIWPVIAERSVAKPGDAAVEKWSRRAIEASKQSGRAWVPQVSPVLGFEEALAQVSGFSLALLADVNPKAPGVLEVLEHSTSAREIIAFVGPEGGWSETERALASAARLSLVRLSPTVLRAETAAVALCSAMCLASS